MIYVYSLMMIALSSLLWRIRGGLWKEIIPANKVWYAVFFAVMGCIGYSFSIENFAVGLIACYASYQLYGWGLYVGRLILGGIVRPEIDKECELIDNLLFPLHITLKGTKYYLYQYPKLFGFCGTTLTGLIITFIWGLYMGSIGVMLSGLAMGVCYWLGGQLNKLIPETKLGWGYGEYIFGAYLGAVIVWWLLW